MLGAVTTISVHTELERSDFVAAFGIEASRVSVADHGAYFERRTTVDREAARARLGIPEDAFVFLSIGFLQPHKGFDRAVRAFAGLGDHGCRLEVVGSLRVEDTEYVAYLDELRELVGETPGAALHEGYVSDAVFDVWIVAADVLVLPYRLIWSSGVCERAALYRRPVIASRTGGLADQVPGDAVLVADDGELAAAMRSAAGLVVDDGVRGGWSNDGRDAVMAEIRGRAARRRPDRTGTTSGRASARASGARTAPLRQIRPLAMPEARSARPGASLMKRVVRRLTAWQIDPIIGQVNRLQQATIDTVSQDGGSEPPA